MSDETLKPDRPRRSTRASVRPLEVAQPKKKLRKVRRNETFILVVVNLFFRSMVNKKTSMLVLRFVKKQKWIRWKSSYEIRRVR